MKSTSSLHFWNWKNLFGFVPSSVHTDSTVSKLESQAETVSGPPVPVNDHQTVLTIRVPVAEGPCIWVPFSWQRPLVGSVVLIGSPL